MRTLNEYHSHQSILCVLCLVQRVRHWGTTRISKKRRPILSIEPFFVDEGAYYPSSVIGLQNRASSKTMDASTYQCFQ
jgi:hypothetical protein